MNINDGDNPVVGSKERDESKGQADLKGGDAGEGGGEDEGSAPKEGRDDHLKEDQKPITH